MDSRVDRRCPWCRADWAELANLATCKRLPEKVASKRPTPPRDALGFRLAWPLYTADRKTTHGTDQWARFLVDLRKHFHVLKGPQDTKDRGNEKCVGKVSSCDETGGNEAPFRDQSGTYPGEMVQEGISFLSALRC